MPIETQQESQSSREVLNGKGPGNPSTWLLRGTRVRQLSLRMALNSFGYKIQFNRRKNINQDCTSQGFWLWVLPGLCAPKAPTL